MASKVASVEGVANLQRTLAVAAGALGRLHSERSGQRVAQAVRRRVPRLSGTLAASIRPVFSETKGTRVMVGGRAVRYAPAQEYGVKAHNIPAQPYARPALAEVQEAVVKDYEEEVQKDLDKVKGA